MKKLVLVRISLIILFGLCLYSAFAKTESNQASVVDLEFIEQLGSSDDDQDALQAAMQAYSKNAYIKNKDANAKIQTSTEQRSNVPQLPSSKKAGSSQ